MLNWKVAARFVAMVTLLSINFVLFPYAANAAKFCAELRGATATGHPDCSFKTLAACRSHIRAGGGGHCYKLRH
jgi:hypothetical protein